MTDINLDPGISHSQTQFVSNLSQLCADAQTGTLFIVTTDGTSATISMKDGTIVSLAYRNSVGIEALGELQKLDGCKLRFTPKIILRIDPELPPTDTILAELSGVSSSSAVTSVSPHNDTSNDTTGPDITNAEFVDTSEPPEPVLEADDAEIVSVAAVKVLASGRASELFGPVGPMLVDEKLANFGLKTSLANIERALTEIADEIGEADKTADFVAEVLQELRRRSNNR